MAPKIRQSRIKRAMCQGKRQWILAVNLGIMDDLKRSQQNANRRIDEPRSTTQSYYKLRH